MSALKAFLRTIVLIVCMFPVFIIYVVSRFNLACDVPIGDEHSCAMEQVFSLVLSPDIFRHPVFFGAGVFMSVVAGVGMSIALGVIKYGDRGQ